MSEIELHLGDCLEILPTLPDNSVDAVITDPPYFVNESLITSKNIYNSLNELRWKDDFKWIPSIANLLVFGGCLYVFTSDNQISFLRQEIENNGLRIFNRLHWIKTNPMPSYTKRCYLGGVELAYYCIKNGKTNKFNFTNQRDMRSVWSYPVVSGNERTEHPTQKPLGLIKEWIEDSTTKGDTILDPFMGSGTTGVACVQTGRNFIGIEIEPKYFEIAEKRIAEAQKQMVMEI